MLQDATARSSQLTEAFRVENSRQCKEFEYQELQGGVLVDEHTKLKEIGQEISSRTNEMEKKVGV